MALFRMMFGTILALEGLRYFAREWVHEFFIEPRISFAYFTFDWVKAWPGEWMYVHFAVIVLTAALFALGICYRVAASALFLSFSYQFLIDQTYYLNHFYAAALFLFIFLWLPVARSQSKMFSRAALRRTWEPDAIPVWFLWLIRLQIAVIYCFGGIAKLSAEWMSGVPGQLVAEGAHGSELVEWIASNGLGGIVFGAGGTVVDLAVIPMLLWRRTRVIGACVATLFHLANSQLFAIGMFPWMMMAATLLFFEPDWPRQALAWLREMPYIPYRASGVSTGQLLSTRGVVLLCTFVALQVAVPLRHVAYPGDVDWTEEGYRFSWRMMLKRKSASLRMWTVGVEGRSEVNLREYLSEIQMRRIGWQPDMILQLAHAVRDDAIARGDTSVMVFADARVSLNARPSRPLIDTTVDLARQRRSLRHARWLLH